jgi:hypothetical protein
MLPAQPVDLFGEGRRRHRGKHNDTPLGLPESLTHLVAWLDSR